MAGRVLRSIEEFELPEVIREGLRNKGIQYFTPPQAEAIEKGVLNGENIVVATPTASGKTLIAEMVLIKAAIEGRIGLYATPLKALAMEKYEEFKFWERYGVKVGISTGDFDEPGEALGKYNIIIATYERLDSILRHKPSWLPKVSVVTVDELHTIKDVDRGPIVELIATRAIHLGKQVVGLSATIGNPRELAKWLSAKLVTCEWRPVKLIEGYYDKYRREIIFSDGRVEEVRAPDLVIHIINEAIKEDYQVLIFKQARKQAESVARKVAQIISRSLNDDEVKKLNSLVRELKNSTSSKVEFENLAPLIERGAAYHHAGLSLGARKVVEKGFRSRLIKTVIATPTLAAGINLPARRVVIYTKRFEGGYLKPIPVAEYKQMAGRAGRPQYDPYGEAIVADAHPDEAQRYVYGKPEAVSSKLWSERALRIHVLATIVAGYADSIKGLIDFFAKTFGAQSYRFFFAKYMVSRIVNQLRTMGMISESEYLRASKLGELVSKLYIDPLTADIVIRHLGKAPTYITPLYYLHIIALTPDFGRVRITGYRGLREEALALAEEGYIPLPDEVDVDFWEWLRGFKIARILESWIEEFDEDYIVTRYNIGPGDLATLIDTASWLVHASSVICGATHMREHSKNLEILSMRVEKGVKEDVIELTRIKGIGRVRARILANMGIKTIQDLLKVPEKKLAELPTFGEKVAKTIIEEARRILSKYEGSTTH